MDAGLAMLSVIASQALYVTGRLAPPRLRGFLDMVRAAVPPVDEDRILGPELERLTGLFTRQVFEEDLIAPRKTPSKAAARARRRSPSRGGMVSSPPA
jgi:histidine ammonia-lyase